jgi:hypothetical protein
MLLLLPLLKPGRDISLTTSLPQTLNKAFFLQLLDETRLDKRLGFGQSRAPVGFR